MKGTNSLFKNKLFRSSVQIPKVYIDKTFILTHPALSFIPLSEKEKTVPRDNLYASGRSVCQCLVYVKYGKLLLGKLLQSNIAAFQLGFILQTHRHPNKKPNFDASLRIQWTYCNKNTSLGIIYSIKTLFLVLAYMCYVWSCSISLYNNIFYHFGNIKMNKIILLIIMVLQNDYYFFVLLFMICILRWKSYEQMQ